MVEFLDLAQKCAPTVAPQTMAAIVRVESGFNPYAIGVVGGALVRQPANREEAIATVKALEAGGWNFSLGIAQVNRYNLPKYGTSYEEAFEPCRNLHVGSKILEDCFVRASVRSPDSQAALHAAFSCYYSGNFTRGFRPDAAGMPSYVQKVVASTALPAKAIPVVPLVSTGSGGKPQASEPDIPRAKSTAVRKHGSDPSSASVQSPVLLREAGLENEHPVRGEAASPERPGDGNRGDAPAKDRDADHLPPSRSRAIVF